MFITQYKYDDKKKKKKGIPSNKQQGIRRGTCLFSYITIGITRATEKAVSRPPAKSPTWIVWVLEAPLFFFSLTPFPLDI